MILTKISQWLLSHKKIALNAILSLLLAFSIYSGTILHRQNKTLLNRLEMANNNIEAYQEIAAGAVDHAHTLELTIEDFKSSNDKLVQLLDSVQKQLKLKTNGLKTAATQTQTLLVKGGKGVEEDSIILKTYSDSITFNDETIVYYTLSPDSVDITLDISNTQYLYTYKTREYKNKKSFFKRLFTFDFKKVDKYNYVIKNSNELIKENDIRIIEIIK